MKQWVLNALIGFDDWSNTLLGGAPDQTISSRSAQARDAGKWWGCKLCGFLDWLQPGHCDGAIKGDEQRAETVDNDLKVNP